MTLPHIFEKIQIYQIRLEDKHKVVLIINGYSHIADLSTVQ